MTSSAPDQAVVHPNRTRWIALLALLVGIGIAAVITAVVVTRDDGPVAEGSAAQLSQVQASCSDWMESSQSGVPDDQWCTDMFAWMSDQSGGSMMGSMMSQGSEQMSTSCRQWVEQDRADAGSSGQQNCNDMVDWMNGHMSSRNGNWMMQNR